jgi:hypothetical protein
MLKPSKPTPANCQMRDFMVFLSVEKLQPTPVYRAHHAGQLKFRTEKGGHGLPSGIVVRARHLWRRLTSRRLLGSV